MQWDSTYLRQGTSYQCRYMDPNLDLDLCVIRIATKISLIIVHCELPTLPENFMQIRSEVFAQSCKRIDRQTNKRRLHNLLGGGKNWPTDWLIELRFYVPLFTSHPFDTKWMVSDFQCSSQPISWQSTKEMKSNTIKASKTGT